MAHEVGQMVIPKVIMQLYAMQMTSYLKNFLLATY